MQYENLISKLLDLGIEEDINTGDITTESIIPESMNAVATMTAKQEGVISGLEIVKMVYDRFQSDVVFTPYFKDGDFVQKGDVILKIEATYPTLLRGERLSLNLFQRMCGIFTFIQNFLEGKTDKETVLIHYNHYRWYFNARSLRGRINSKRSNGRNVDHLTFFIS